MTTKNILLNGWPLMNTAPVVQLRTSSQSLFAIRIDFEAIAKQSVPMCWSEGKGKAVIKKRNKFLTIFYNNFNNKSLVLCKNECLCPKN